MSYVRFSPDAKRFVLDRWDGYECEYRIYVFDGLEYKKTLEGAMQSM